MRRVTVTVVVVGVLAAVAAVVTLRGGREWSLRSSGALAAWEAALEAEQKLYVLEERKALERVLELEPGYPPAMVRLAALLRGSDPDRARRLLEGARSVDLGRLRPRERFIVELWRAILDEDLERASEVIDRYAGRLPDDPMVLTARARRAWALGRYGEAEELYRRLVEVEPNLVIAYNQLGYLAMTRGEFAEAERRLVAYRFIAPDQANPHDSLGELYALTGRYDEARRELEAAVAVRPDFCAAYAHLVVVELLAGDAEAALAAAGRMERVASCPESYRRGMACLARWVLLAGEGRWEEVWSGRQACLRTERVTALQVLAQEAALQLGLDTDALRLETEAAFRIAPERGPVALGRDPRLAVVEWMRARRQRWEGRSAEAERLLASADARLGYAGSEIGVLKLQIRLERVRDLGLLGREEEAGALLEEVAAVNPPLARRFRETGRGPLL